MLWLCYTRSFLCRHSLNPMLYSLPPVIPSPCTASMLCSSPTHADSLWVISFSLLFPHVSSPFLIPCLTMHDNGHWSFGSCFSTRSNVLLQNMNSSGVLCSVQMSVSNSHSKRALRGLYNLRISTTYFIQHFSAWAPQEPGRFVSHACHLCGIKPTYTYSNTIEHPTSLLKY